MNIFSKIKNFFSPFSLSYKLVKNNVDFDFMKKSYKNGWLSFFSFMTVNSIIISYIMLGCYLNSFLIGVPGIILFLIHTIGSFANWAADDKYFFTSVFRQALFKFSKKYQFLVKNDKKMKKEIINQDELTNFIQKEIAYNNIKKELFAKLLTKKNFKPFTQYELLKFSMKHCKSSDYVSRNFNEIKKLYLSNDSLFNKKKANKFNKGLEIIDCLASGKKLGMNEKGQIILNNNEHLIAVKKGE